MKGPARGQRPRAGAGSWPTGQNRVLKHNKRKMSLAKTLALNKRGKQNGNISPASKVGQNRGKATLKADSRAVETRPERIPRW